MSHNKINSLVFLLIICVTISAKDNDSTKQVSLLEFGTANDLFQLHEKSDKYFSASFRLGIINESLDNKASRFALLGTEGDVDVYGLTFIQDGFTPEDLTDPNIIYDDRPYAGLLYGQYWRSSTDVSKNLRYKTSIKLGVAGPLSGVEKVQVGLHDRTGSTPPRGWDNQIANALILEYTAGVSKRLVSTPYFEYYIGANAEVGTFFNFIEVENSIKFGFFNDEMQGFYGLGQKKQMTRDWQCYVSLSLADMFVFYDGTLQGGLIAFGESPHTYSWSDYRHNTPVVSYCLNLSYHNLYLRYSNVTQVSRYFVEDFFSFGVFELLIPIGK